MGHSIAGTVLGGVYRTTLHPPFPKYYKFGLTAVGLSGKSGACAARFVAINRVIALRTRRRKAASSRTRIPESAMIHSTIFRRVHGCEGIYFIAQHIMAAMRPPVTDLMWHSPTSAIKSRVQSASMVMGEIQYDCTARVYEAYHPRISFGTIHGLPEKRNLTIFK
jgi:hypothetical protein